MKYIHLFEVLTQIFSFIGTQNTQGKVQQCPQMQCFPCVVIDFGHVMHLGVAVMAGCDAVCRTRCQNLVGLGLAVCPSLLLESGLQVTAAAAAAEVVGPVGRHVDKVFFTHDRFDHIAQVFGNRITQRFSDELAGILYGEFDLSFLVPVG
jgi:phosphoribosyl 1,2-cyclic phosphodiesterase